MFSTFFSQHSANFSSGFGLTGLTVKFTELEIGRTISICGDIIFNIYKRKYTAKYRVQKYYLKKYDINMFYINVPSTFFIIFRVIIYTTTKLYFEW